MKLIPADKFQIPISDFISDYYSTSLKADYNKHIKFLFLPQR